jgi:hypothetical protein
MYIFAQNQNKDKQLSSVITKKLLPETKGLGWS